MVVADSLVFLQMFQKGEEAETVYLAGLRKTEHYWKLVDLKASWDPEAKLIFTIYHPTTRQRIQAQVT